MLPELRQRHKLRGRAPDGKTRAGAAGAMLGVRGFPLLQSRAAAAPDLVLRRAEATPRAAQDAARSARHLARVPRGAGEDMNCLHSSDLGPLPKVRRGKLP